jgi:hypothetical protein
MSKAEPIEVWRDIKGFRGYQVSDLGRVRSFHHLRGWGLQAESHLVKPGLTNNGHLMVSLRRQGRGHHRYVHRLVLEAFLGPCPPGMETRRLLDSNRVDNRLQNLCWGTRSEIIADKHRRGTQVNGEGCHAAKMTAHSVRQLVRLRAGGMTLKTLAVRFGIRYENVRRILGGEHWKHLRLTLPRVDRRYNVG